MAWVRPDRKILSHTPAKAQLYDAIMVQVSVKLGLKCTVPTESWPRDPWRRNHYAICSPTAASSQVMSINTDRYKNNNRDMHGHVRVLKTLRKTYVGYSDF